MPVLEAVDLYRFYHVNQEETLALRGVNLSISAGQMVAVMGPSGSGKTTLLACLAGLDEPDGGYVALSGERISRRPEAEKAAIRACRIGIMLQFGNLFDHLSIVDNIALQLHLAGMWNVRKVRIEELLERMALQHIRWAYPARISGGESARAALAVAISAKPQLLLADEPTAEVDAGTEKRIIELLMEYRDQGGTVLLATHSAALASAANRIIYLRDGKVAPHG